MRKTYTKEAYVKDDIKALLDWLEAFLESFDISVECASRKMEVPPEHGARMLNALAELSNKLLDTSGD
jgi:hypothetical protein